MRVATTQHAAKLRHNLAQGGASGASGTLGYNGTRQKARFSGRQKLTLGALVALSAIFYGCSRPATNPSSTPSPSTNSEVRSSADVVTVAGTGTAMSSGNSGEALVLLNIEPGYHVNANPATYPYLIATKVTPTNVEGLEVAQPVYPPAKKQKFQFEEQPLAVYEGQVEIKLPLKVASKGSRSLPLNVLVQACDHEKCFPPATLNTTVSVEVK